MDDVDWPVRGLAHRGYRLPAPSQGWRMGALVVALYPRSHRARGQLQRTLAVAAVYSTLRLAMECQSAAG